MSSVLDPVKDKNLAMFHRLNILYQIPDFVKSASVNTIDEDAVKALPSAAFADPVYRQFPCHTKAATFLSYMYFLNGANGLTKWAHDDIHSRLQDFINYWGLRLECDGFKDEFNKTASQTIKELPDDCFAMVETYGDSTIRRLPIINRETVKTAAAYLYENRDKFPYEWRKRAARKILKKTAELNANLPAVVSEYINKCAGFGIGSHLKIARALRDRAILMKSDTRPATREIYEKTLMAAKTAAELHGIRGDVHQNPELFTKAAEFIANIDNATEMYKLYKRGLPTPEEVVYELTEKVASDINNSFVQLTTGNSYRRSDIEKAAFEPFKLLGNDFVEEVQDALGNFDLTKAATILATLPRNDASIYEKGMKMLKIANERQIRKEANLPDRVADWDADDWQNYISSMGHKSKPTNFAYTVDLNHDQRADK